MNEGALHPVRQASCESRVQLWFIGDQCGDCGGLYTGGEFHLWVRWSVSACVRCVMDTLGGMIAGVRFFLCDGSLLVVLRVSAWAGRQ